MVGLLGDVISANRKILQDVQYHVRKMDYSRQECEDEKSSDLVKMSQGYQNEKRLLITGSTFPRYENDTEPRFILDLAKYMKEYAEVTVLVPAAPKAADTEVLEGVSVIRYHYFPVHSLETLCYPGAIVPRIREKKVRGLLVPWLFVSLWVHLFKMRKSYDIVQANWLIPQGIVQSFLKMPYIVTGHGADVTSLNHGLLKN